MLSSLCIYGIALLASRLVLACDTWYFSGFLVLYAILFSGNISIVLGFLVQDNSSPSGPFLSEIISLDLHQIMGSINTNTGIMIHTMVQASWSRFLSGYIYDLENDLGIVIQTIIWSFWLWWWSGHYQQDNDLGIVIQTTIWAKWWKKVSVYYDQGN